jgi:hexosaminidase
MKKLFYFLLVFLLVSFGCSQRNEINIVPEPVRVMPQDGHFSMNKNTEVRFKNTGDNNRTAQYIMNYFPEYFGLNLKVSDDSSATDDLIVFEINEVFDPEIGNEGYKMIVSKEYIEITANANAGLFYGFQSLYQMAPPDITKKHKSSICIPAVTIIDYPRFEWRGSHRDVSRHFFDVEHIKKHLDLMALYKLNKFHWHLTDDHGWRLEIDKYPELTEIGAWRVDRTGIPWREGEPPKEGEAATYGGYYTKEQVRDVVAYAAQRNIDILPEIEIPGHCSEILATYPRFACDDYPYIVEIGPYWPPKAILCGGNDDVMKFLKDVIDEVAELFPYEYIHVGGDEALKDNWKECPKCQKRIKDLRLKDEEALQGWMIREVEKQVNKHGKKIIGWDEIIEGGVTSSATLMLWRAWEQKKVIAEAVKHGNEIVMTPTSHCYFDYYQGDPETEPEAICCYIPLEKVYIFDPVPEGLSAEEARLIKGGQCNLWAEFIYDGDKAEYMLLPRLLAMSESVWSQKSKKEWTHFLSRLDGQKERLSALNYNYSTIH